MSRRNGSGPGLFGALLVVFAVLCVLEYVGRHAGLALNPVGWLDVAVDSTVTWFDTDVTGWVRPIIEENT